MRTRARQGASLTPPSPQAPAPTSIRVRTGSGPVGAEPLVGLVHRRESHARLRLHVVDKVDEPVRVVPATRLYPRVHYNDHDAPLPVDLVEDVLPDVDDVIQVGASWRPSAIV